jgi:hypothetical protein
MQTHEEFNAVMTALEEKALQRVLAQPAVAFALHAARCHHDMLAALKRAANVIGSDLNFCQKHSLALDAIRAAIVKAEWPA